jgi:hypothetical protein
MFALEKSRRDTERTEEGHRGRREITGRRNTEARRDTEDAEDAEDTEDTEDTERSTRPDPSAPVIDGARGSQRRKGHSNDLQPRNGRPLLWPFETAVPFENSL